MFDTDCRDSPSTPWWCTRWWSSAPWPPLLAVLYTVQAVAGGTGCSWPTLLLSRCRGGVGALAATASGEVARGAGRRPGLRDTPRPGDLAARQHLRAAGAAVVMLLFLLTPCQGRGARAGRARRGAAGPGAPRLPGSATFNAGHSGAKSVWHGRSRTDSGRRRRDRRRRLTAETAAHVGAGRLAWGPCGCSWPWCPPAEAVDRPGRVPRRTPGGRGVPLGSARAVPRHPGLPGRRPDRHLDDLVERLGRAAARAHDLRDRTSRRWGLPARRLARGSCGRASTSTRPAARS